MAKSDIDETDLRILAELNRNARASDIEIAKKAGLSIPTVNLRIDEFEKRGLIKGYVARIDFFRLGYPAHRAYLKLQYANTSSEQRMMDYLKNSPYCRWCGKTTGRFDLAASFLSRDTSHFLEVWNDFKRTFRHNIKEAALVPYYGDLMTGPPLSKDMSGSITKDVIGADGNVKIDEKDRIILRILASNGRESYSDISRSIGLTPASVKYRMDKLMEKKVLVSFRALLDYEKLGYSAYKIDFNLDSFDGKEKMEEYLVSKQGVTNLIRSAGWADVEIRACVRTLKELGALLNEVQDEFPIIRDCDSYGFSEEVKLTYMPAF